MKEQRFILQVSKISKKYKYIFNVIASANFQASSYLHYF